jgi:excisionase family DNA binding protein
MRSTTWLTPPEIARELGIDVHKPLKWITSGELAAVNLAERPGARPRYKVSREALDRFLEVRTVQPPAPRQKRARRLADVPTYV